MPTSEAVRLAMLTGMLERFREASALSEAEQLEQNTIVKEYKIENDDPEELRKAKEMDEFKDGGTLLPSLYYYYHYYYTIIIIIIILFFYQPSSVRGWTLAFLLAVHRLCGVIEGRLSHFLPPWVRTGGQSVISQGKFL